MKEPTEEYIKFRKYLESSYKVNSSDDSSDNSSDEDSDFLSKKKIKGGAKKEVTRTLIFDEEYQIPDDIRDFFSIQLKIKKMKKTEVVKLFFSYIKENNLRDEKRPALIKYQMELFELLGLNKGDKLTYYNLQTYVDKLYE
jgi:hypothetical protein